MLSYIHELFQRTTEPKKVVGTPEFGGGGQKCEQLASV